LWGPSSVIHSLIRSRFSGFGAFWEKIRPKPELPLDDEAEQNGFDNL